MEIEFKVRILADECRQQLVASVGFALGFILLFTLIGLYFKPILPLCILLGCLVGSLNFKTYLKLRAQEKCPDRLRISHHSLIYFSNDKKALEIPIKAISKLEYQDGLILFLRRPVSERIEILDKKILSKKGRGDFYFEWFEPKVYSLIQAELHDVMHANKTD